MRLNQVVFTILICVIVFSKSQSQDIERNALVFLIGVLNDPYLSSNEDTILPLDFEEDMECFKKGKYYSNGKLCLISWPEDIFDQSVMGASRDILSGFSEFRNNLKTDYKPKSIELPSIINKMDYLSYTDKGKQYSYFFTVRHHINTQNIYLVQIHVTPFEKSRNPFEYTFHIYFDGDKIANWNVSMMGDFEFDIDC